MCGHWLKCVMQVKQKYRFTYIHGTALGVAMLADVNAILSVYQCVTGPL